MQVSVWTMVKLFEVDWKDLLRPFILEHKPTLVEVFRVAFEASVWAFSLSVSPAPRNLC